MAGIDFQTFGNSDSEGLIVQLFSPLLPLSKPEASDFNLRESFSIGESLISVLPLSLHEDTLRRSVVWFFVCFGTLCPSCDASVENIL